MKFSHEKHENFERSSENGFFSRFELQIRPPVVKNPKIRKRGSHFLPTQAFRVQNPHFYTGHHREKGGFFLPRNNPFFSGVGGGGEMGVVRLQSRFPIWGLLTLASRKRCDLKTRKRCDFFSAAQKIASDFSAISSGDSFCDFCGKTRDLVLCDSKTQRLGGNGACSITKPFPIWGFLTLCRAGGFATQTSP